MVTLSQHSASQRGGSEKQIKFIDLQSYYAGSQQSQLLHPVISQSIIFSAFAGMRNVPIDRIVQQVIRVHRHNQGIFPTNWAFDPRRKLFVAKALKNLRSAGLAYKLIDNNTRGHWCFSNPAATAITTGSDFFQEGEEVNTAEVMTGNPDLEITTGNNSATTDRSEWIYVMYNQADMELANLRGDETFPCKIGRTSVNPLRRTDARTYLYAAPILKSFVVCNSRLIERVLHEMLTEKRIMTEGLGTEWFDTNPAEVEDIIAGIEDLRYRGSNNRVN